MKHDLNGKRILVSAAGQGIGRASALQLADAGATVIATDINQETLATLDGRARISTRILNVTDQSAIDAAAGEILADGPIDGLFNCAGYVHQGSIFDCSEKDWDFSFDLNVKSQYRMISAFLPSMIENGGGSIINMASVVSSIIAAPNRFVYGATKAAVIGLTKSVAADYVTNGIRCNAICPGTVDTPSLEGRMRDLGDYEKARASFLERQPTGKLAGADDIASLVVFLASDSSTFMTGEAIRIDGGWSNT